MSYYEDRVAEADEEVQLADSYMEHNANLCDPSTCRWCSLEEDGYLRGAEEMRELTSWDDE